MLFGNVITHHIYTDDFTVFTIAHLFTDLITENKVSLFYKVNGTFYETHSLMSHFAFLVISSLAEVPELIGYSGVPRNSFRHYS